jgi:exodeoxyribonuclease V gamma subunit
MALSLHFANSTESLFKKFSGRLRETWKDPFKPPVLLIQNRIVDKWLKLQLARERGCVMAISGVFLEKFLWDLAAGESDEPVHAEEMQFRILKFLRKIPGDKVFDPLREYVGDDARRRVQLSARLARLLLEYEVNRPDLYGTDGDLAFKGVSGEWGRGNYSYFGSKIAESRREDAAGLERWQAGLYKAVWDGRTGDGITLPRLWRKTVEKGLLKERVEAARLRERPINIFGAPGFGLFYRQALIDISAVADMNVYLLNPCGRFWEKDPARPDKVALQLDKKDWMLFEKPAEEQRSKWGEETHNRLLQLWGRIGRDNIALWCQAKEYGFEYEAVEPGSEKQDVLATLQRTLLSRSESAKRRVSQDESIEIAAVPGIRREVERLRERIIELLCKDPSLRLDEVGVFCPDPGKYRIAFDDVFGSVPDNSPEEHPHFIPFEFMEQNAGRSLYVLAVCSMLDLIDGRFSRSRVFALLRNPLVRAARGITAERVSLWEGWADGLHIHHGFNRDDRALRETAPVGQHTWRRGIERLCLGPIASEPVMLDRQEGLFGPDELVLPFRDMGSSDTQELSLFAQTVEDLFRDIQAFRGGRDPAGGEAARIAPLEISGLTSPRTWGKWCGHLRAILDAWIEMPSSNPDVDPRDYNQERIVRTSFHNSLDSIGAREDEGEIGWDEAALVIRERLDFELPARSTALSGKLMVCTLREARPLPWRVSFVLGMQAGEFPPRENEDRLDLRTWRAMPGDTSPRRSMQYAFLELLACTRERLILSYQCMDMANGARMLPCSTLLELKGFLEDSVLPAGERWKEREVPLLAEEDCSPSVVLPRTEKLLEAAQNPLPPERTFPDRLFDPAREAGRQASDKAAPVSWKQAIAVLRDPYSASLRRVLGLYDEESTDTTDKDDEPVEVDHLKKWKITDRWLAEVGERIFKDGSVPQLTEVELQKMGGEAWAKIRVELPPQGWIPEKLVGDAAWETLKEKCGKIPKGILNMCGMLKGRKVDRGFAIEADGEFLTGKTPKFVLCTGNGPPAIVVMTAGKAKLRNLLDAWLLCAVGKVKGDPQTAGTVGVILISKDGLEERTFSFTLPAAEKLLSSIRDACNDPERFWEFLPVEAVENAEPKTAEGVQEWIDQELEKEDFGYGLPLEAMTFDPPRVASTAEQIMDERFKGLIAEEDDK